MPGLLYPAYQKMYSALSSLERFDKEANFFDNISCIDTFFSEYRNITFAVQSQLKHTEFYDEYEKNRDKYLTDHWFVDKRNETTKRQPFQLVKRIAIVFYLPDAGFPLYENVFSVENDTPLDSLIGDLKELFAKIDPYEVFFSVSFSFYEKNNNEDLLEKLLSGISSMKQFMFAMDRVINEDCQLCNQLKRKINNSKITQIPREFLLTNDYAYYPDQERFERGSKVAMMMAVNGEELFQRQPITQITQRTHCNYDGTVFGNFTFQHAFLRVLWPGLEIMSVFLIVYEDGTYDMDVFHTDIKTTLYRKIKEISEMIATQNIIQVCFISLYALTIADENTPHHSSDRVKQSTSDCLVCASLDSKLEQKEYVFDGKKVEDPRYIDRTMRAGFSELNISKRNMFPIWRAFNAKQQLIQSSNEDNGSLGENGND